MAKQSGLHQLKGKVDGYSYYRQSGVKSGLMRRINEGLSSRVKTSEEFANTRLNNAEFGNSADVAKVLASVITPKFRPMFLNFSQAKLTKSLLALIKQGDDDWGQRSLQPDDKDAICAAANMLAKNDFGIISDGFTSAAGTNVGDTALSVSLSADNISVISSYGADGVAVKFIVVAIHSGNYITVDKAYSKSFAKVLGTVTNEQSIAGGPTTVSANLSADDDDIPTNTKFLISLAILMPYRTINNKKYILQEKCTFKMIPSVVLE